MKRAISLVIAFSALLGVLAGNAVAGNGDLPVLMPRTETMKDIDRYLYMPKSDIVKELGNSYKVVETGSEGLQEGFYYEDIGLTFTFDEESQWVLWIDCDSKVDINGARAGMDFSQIQKALGKGQITETWVETPENVAYELGYRIGDSLVYFLSYQQSGEDSEVYIMPANEWPCSSK